MVASIKDAHRDLTETVMGRKGVSGTAIGMSGGKPCLKVYLSDPDAQAKLPTSVGGFPVIAENTGTFRRL